MVDKKIDEKEALELKELYNLYFDKRKEMTKKTHFKVDDNIGDNNGKDILSQDQIIKPNRF